MNSESSNPSHAPAAAAGSTDNERTASTAARSSASSSRSPDQIANEGSPPSGGDATQEARTPSLDFIRQIIADDLKANKHDGQVVTRFPPEPNGYLHIGHAKSICLNFGLAQEGSNRRCHLRFDDTNPEKEEQEYVDSIINDIRWLGFDWGDHLYFASDYFEQMYNYAVDLIRQGKAYVDSQSAEDIRRQRGTLTEPGTESPHRSRSVEENLDLFARMRAGEFGDGEHVLRAKIDMKSPNINMRDPVLYRIKHAHHHRTGDDWCIYPMYDYAHCLEDAIECITHSLCTLEFEDHRPLYDWILDQLEVPSHPRQIEFARLNLNYTVMSKRKFIELVRGKHVDGWDDPRMPTISGMRRRGYTPESIRTFSTKVGIAKRNNVSDMALLEHCVRDHLNKVAERRMVVQNPLKVVIENYPEGQVEMMEAVNNPEDESAGTREVPFSKVLYIERDDFMEDPPKKFFRLGPGREVRLRYAYFITCTDFVKDPETGEVTELRCTYDPETRGGNAPDGRKVKGTLHWVSAEHAADCEIRLYDRLFNVPDPNDVDEEAGQTWLDHLNPESLQVVTGCKAEPSLKDAAPGDRVQFERQGYFCVDTRDADPANEKLIFNRTVALRDSWSKIAGKGQK